MIAKDLVIRAPNIKFFDDMVQYSRSVVKHVNGTSAFEDRGGGPKYSQFHADFWKNWQSCTLALLPQGWHPPTRNPPSASVQAERFI